jgi:hypothetical protein
VILSLDDGHSHAAEVFGKRLRVVCGDTVIVETNPATHALQVKELLPRRTHFTRTDSRGQPEVLAANITQLVVLMSEQPPAIRISWIAIWPARSSVDQGNGCHHQAGPGAQRAVRAVHA